MALCIDNALTRTSGVFRIWQIMIGNGVHVSSSTHLSRPYPRLVAPSAHSHVASLSPMMHACSRRKAPLCRLPHPSRCSPFARSCPVARAPLVLPLDVPPAPSLASGSALTHPVFSSPTVASSPTPAAPMAVTPSPIWNLAHSGPCECYEIL
jgi:hypothetical protein